MKRKSIELQEKRKGVLEKMDAIIKTSEKEDRNLSTDEQENFNNFAKEVKDLEQRTQRAVDMEIRQLEDENAATKKLQPGEEKEIAKYSVVRAIRDQISGGLTGFEAEMHQEARNEASKSGLIIEGLGIPKMIWQRRKANNQDKTFRGDANYQFRDMTVGTTTTGGHAVETEKPSLIEGLRPELVFERLGARYLENLHGDLTFPRYTTLTSGTWATETGPSGETTPTFDTVSLSPKRCVAYTEVSRQLMAQVDSFSVEQFVREDLRTTITEDLEDKMIEGTGVAPNIKGILTYSATGDSINDINFGASGGAPTWSNMVSFESEVASDDALKGSLAYLTNPKVRGKLKTTEIGSATPGFIMATDSTVNGYPCAITTQMPSDLTKTASNLSAIIFGNWRDMLIGNWGGIDLIVDPYSLATQGMIRITINTYWDMVLRHGQSFAYSNEVITT